jgi:hypothetical protein
MVGQAAAQRGPPPKPNSVKCECCIEDYIDPCPPAAWPASVYTSARAAPMRPAARPTWPRAHRRVSMLGEVHANARRDRAGATLVSQCPLPGASRSSTRNTREPGCGNSATKSTYYALLGLRCNPGCERRSYGSSRLQLPARARAASTADMSSAIIFQWLERIGLGYAVPSFQAMGITTPQALMSLTFEQYDAVGVTEGRALNNMCWTLASAPPAHCGAA